MFSNMNEKSISLWVEPKKGNNFAAEPQTSLTIGLGKKTEKEYAGILKAIKHLQKILGCENGAQDQEARLKKMFEE